MDEPPKPTHLSQHLAFQLLKRFGRQDAIPVELQEAAWLIHMRLVEAERDIEHLWQRLATYAPGAAAAPPPASASLAGDETGEF